MTGPERWRIYRCDGRATVPDPGCECGNWVAYREGLPYQLDRSWSAVVAGLDAYLQKWRAS